MSETEKPAILGGKPAFKQILPMVKPPIKPHITAILADHRRILKSGMVTNHEYVKKLEEATAAYVGVRHCVAMANCTSALILALKALKLKTGEVLMPSFTFPATAHAAHWAGFKIRLVDCDPRKLTIDTNDLQRKITDRSKIVMPVHVFGNPCDIEEITAIAKEHDLKVIYDSAHGFGAKYRNRKIGQFGDAEVFSGSPTKAFTTIEGGIVTTDNAEITRRMQLGRTYGQSGSYNCEMQGLSARMSELHAAVGLHLLPHVDSDIRKRNDLAAKYKTKLSKLPGAKFQQINNNCLSTYKDFAVLIDPDEFGLSRNDLAVALEKERITTRKYFYPPIHMQQCYPELRAEENEFPGTTKVSNNVLCLPFFSELTNQEIEQVTDSIARIQRHAAEVQEAIGKHRETTS